MVIVVVVVTAVVIVVVVVGSGAETRDSLSGLDPLQSGTEGPRHSAQQRANQQAGSRQLNYLLIKIITSSINASSHRSYFL